MNTSQLTDTEVKLLVGLVASKFAKWSACELFDKYRYLICEPLLDSNLKTRVLVVCNSAPPAACGSTNRYSFKRYLVEQIKKTIPHDVNIHIVYVRTGLPPKKEGSSSRKTSEIDLLSEASVGDKRLFLGAVAKRASSKISSLYSFDLRQQAKQIDETNLLQKEVSSFEDALTFSGGDYKTIVKVAFSAIIEDLMKHLRDRFNIPADMYLSLDRPYSSKRGLIEDPFIKILYGELKLDRYGKELFALLGKYSLEPILDKLAFSTETSCLRFAAIYGNDTQRALILCSNVEQAKKAAELSYKKLVDQAIEKIESLKIKEVG